MGARLLGERLARAQQLLESTDQPIDAIAQRAGFGSAASLRQHFVEVFRIRRRPGGGSFEGRERFDEQFGGRHASLRQSQVAVNQRAAYRSSATKKIIAAHAQYGMACGGGS